MAIVRIPSIASVANTAQVSNVWSPPNLKDWLAQPDPTPRWLLKGLLAADSVIVVSGKAKMSKKTWLAFVLALSVASGRTIDIFQPEDARGQSVLILEAEGASSFTKDRWRKLGKGYGIDVAGMDNIFFSHRQPIVFNDPTWVQRIQAFVAEKQIKLVVVDPLVNFMRGNENDVDAVSAIMRALIAIRDTGASVILLHHLSKPQKDWTRDIDDDLRGSSAIAGAYDQHYALRPLGPGHRGNALTIRFKDGAEERKFEIDWLIDNVSDTATFELLECDGDQYLDRKQDELVTILAGGEEATQKRIEEMLGLDDASDLLSRMLDSEIIVRDGRNYKLRGM